MKVSGDDLKRLRVPIALAGVLAAAGIAALVASQRYLESVKVVGDGTRVSRVAAQERVLRVSEEEREIRESLVDFERMREQGMAADQNRIELIEAISKIKNNRKLFEIKYRVDAQRQLDYPGIVASGRADLVVSRIKLEMLLLHEGDLLSFLDDLRAAKKAYVSVRQCQVMRLERTPVQTATSLRPRLRADCQVDLISIKGLRAGGKPNA
jgi:hypothetical protein